MRPGTVVGQAQLVGLVLGAVKLTREGISLHDRPTLERQAPAWRLDVLLGMHDRLAEAAAIDMGAGIKGVGHRRPDAPPGQRTRLEPALPSALATRKDQALGLEIAGYLADAAIQAETRKHQRDGVLHLLVGIALNPQVEHLDQPYRQAEVQLVALGLAEQPLMQTLVHQVDLVARQEDFEAQQEAVIREPRIEDLLLVQQQRIGQGGHFDQPITL